MEEALGWSKMPHTLTDSSRQWRLTFSVTFEWGLFICTWRSSRWKKVTLSWKVSEPPEKSDNLGEAWAVNTSNIYRAFLRLTAHRSALQPKSAFTTARLGDRTLKVVLQLILLVFILTGAFSKSLTEKPSWKGTAVVMKYIHWKHQ